MNKEFPKRKRLRLQGYNYGSEGCYFITICTNNKQNLFGKYDVGAIHESPAYKLSEKHAVNRCILLNRYGKFVESVICDLPERYNDITIDNYIVMPNHIHMLISINNDINSERAIRESPLQRSLLSKIIGYTKVNVSKEIHKMNPKIDVWQRGYTDHIIRNQTDYENHWNYIEYNALKEYFYKDDVR